MRNIFIILILLLVSCSQNTVPETTNHKTASPAASEASAEEVSKGQAPAATEASFPFELLRHIRGNSQWVTVYSGFSDQAMEARLYQGDEARDEILAGEEFWVGFRVHGAAASHVDLRNFVFQVYRNEEVIRILLGADLLVNEPELNPDEPGQWMNMGSISLGAHRFSPGDSCRVVTGSSLPGQDGLRYTEVVFNLLDN